MRNFSQPVHLLGVTATVITAVLLAEPHTFSTVHVYRPASLGWMLDRTRRPSGSIPSVLADVDGVSQRVTGTGSPSLEQGRVMSVPSDTAIVRHP